MKLLYKDWKVIDMVGVDGSRIIFTVAQIDPAGKDFEVDVRVSGSIYPKLPSGSPNAAKHYLPLVKVLPTLIESRLKDIANGADNLIPFSEDRGYTPDSFNIKVKRPFNLPFVI